jgi:hypothetical protein
MGVVLLAVAVGGGGGGAVVPDCSAMSTLVYEINYGALMRIIGIEGTGG